MALLKQRQDDMKRINRQYKKNGGWDGVKVDPEVREACERMFRLCPYEKRPFPSYALTNNGAAIRAAEQRVAQLEKLDATPVREPVERDGARVYEDREENRIFIDFDLKPDARIRTALKSNGFRWKPSVGVWSGSLNDRTWQAALRIVEAVESENAS